jgi:hypothetical protein
VHIPPVREPVVRDARPTRDTETSVKGGSVRGCARSRVIVAGGSDCHCGVPVGHNRLCEGLVTIPSLARASRGFTGRAVAGSGAL